MRAVPECVGNGDLYAVNAGEFSRQIWSVHSISKLQ